MTQAVLGLLTLESPPDTSERNFAGEFVRFIGAMIVLDAWQFAFHRLFHEVEWLYKHVHVWHHRMFIPFAYGALYQHPFEMLIMDTLSGLVSVSAVGALSVCLRCSRLLAALQAQSHVLGFHVLARRAHAPTASMPAGVCNMCSALVDLLLQ